MHEIKEQLQQLYPQDTTLYEKIVELVKDPVRDIDTVAARNNAALIVYPDHIHDKGIPTLQTLLTFLDNYVKDTVNTIHILPFHPSSADGGFAVTDYDTVEEKFGTWSDVQAIAKKYRLMVDCVANHISVNHNWFQEFLNGNKKYQNYFLWFDKPIDTSWAYRTRAHPLLTEFKKKDGAPVWVWTNFSTSQVDLNYKNPDVFFELTKVFLQYFRRGASIVRIDAAGYLWKEVGTPSVHMPQTHTILSIWRVLMEKIKPNTRLITETNVPNKINVQYFGKTHPEAHMVYNFTLSPLLLYTFMKQNTATLREWIQTLSTPRKDTAYFNSTQTHDGVNVRSAEGVISSKDIEELAKHTREVGGNVNMRLLADGSTEPYELAVVYRSFLGSIEALLASQSIALSLDGMPGIYLNSLIGAKNWEEGVEKTHDDRSINRKKYTYEEITKLLTQDSAMKTVIAQYSHMLRIRAKEPLCAPHIPQQIIDVSPKIFALLKTHNEKKLLTLTNVANTLVSIDASKILGKINEAIDILTERTYRFELNPIIFLRPYQCVWIKIR